MQMNVSTGHTLLLKGNISFIFPQLWRVYPSDICTVIDTLTNQQVSNSDDNNLVHGLHALSRNLLVGSISTVYCTSIFMMKKGKI